MISKKAIISFLLMAIISNISLFSQVKIIYDTDFDSDIDDVGALYLLYALADQGKVEILATILSSTHFWSPFALDAVNTYWGHPDMPIGAPSIDGVNKGSVYAETVAKTFPNDLGQKKRLEDATILYRRMLASQADSSVTIVTVGHLTNIAKLLASGPDESSPLPGKELVYKKVKCWVAMLGLGMNWNMKWDPDASKKAINEFPVATVLTVEGQEVRTGKQTQTLLDTNPIKTVFRLWEKHYGEIDRSSWDQIATLFAVEGESDCFTLERGTLVFSEKAGAIWNPDVKGQDYRLYNKTSNKDLANKIEKLMMQEPKE
jgi:inosine-uridine nucleoside N-ribohydrolase